MAYAGASECSLVGSWELYGMPMEWHPPRCRPREDNGAACKSSGSNSDARGRSGGLGCVVIEAPRGGGLCTLTGVLLESGGHLRRGGLWLGYVRLLGPGPCHPTPVYLACDALRWINGDDSWFLVVPI